MHVAAQLPRGSEKKLEVIDILTASGVNVLGTEIENETSTGAGEWWLVPRWRRPTFQMLSCQRDKRATRAISHSFRHPLRPDRGPVGRRTYTGSQYQLKGADEPSPSNRCQERTPPRPYDSSRGRQRVNRNCPYSITPTAHYWRGLAAVRVMLLFSGSLFAVQQAGVHSTALVGCQHEKTGVRRPPHGAG